MGQDEIRSNSHALSETVSGSIRERTFDALPYNIAILDTDGTIVETNRAWRQFGEANGIARRPDSIGVNYLEVAKTGTDESARKAVAGLTEVLHGTHDRFELEYPCHSPDQRQWFHLEATPFSVGGRRRVVVSHRDITDQIERRRQRRDRLEAIDRQRQLAETHADVLLETGDVTTRNEFAHTVCQTLHASPVYSGAWMVTRRDRQYDRMGGAGIAPADGERELWADEPRSERPSGADSLPSLIEAAMETGTVRSLQVSASNGPAVFARHGDRAIAVVPLVSAPEMPTPTVLCLSTTRATAFDGSERKQLERLGVRLKQDMQALTTRQVAHASQRTELEFRCSNLDNPLIALTASHDWQLQLTRATPAESGSITAQFSVAGTSAQRAFEALSTADLGSTIVGERLECTLTQSTHSPLRSLVEQGAVIREGFFADGEGQITAEIAASTPSRAVIEAVTEQVPMTDFTAKRAGSQFDDSKRSVNAIATLTDRQREVLNAAFQAGFFEAPRETSGQTVAASLGIAPATFYQHLQKVHRNVVGHLFESETLDCEGASPAESTDG